MATYTITVLGDKAVGKTSFISQCIWKNYVFQHDYSPTSTAHYQTSQRIDGETYDLKIFEVGAAGSNEAQGKCILSDLLSDFISRSDGFIIVYSLTYFGSSYAVRDFVELIMKVKKVKDATKVPLVLVGNKNDAVVYGDFLTAKDAKKWGCASFEVSSKTRANIDAAFLECIRTIRRHKICGGDQRKQLLLNQIIRLFPQQKWSTLQPLFQLSEKDIENYIKGIKKESVEVVRKKILFVGDARIGKTSLMKCFMNQNRSATSVEPGVDVNEWKFVTRKSVIDKKTETDSEIEVSATLWDFAGQEEYYPCHQFFFSGTIHKFF